MSPKSASGQQKMRRAIITVFIFSGLIMFGLAGYFALQTKKFLDGATPALGNFIAVETYQGTCGSGKNSNPCTRHRSLMKFTLPTGESREEKIEGDFTGRNGVEILFNVEAEPKLRLKAENFWIMPIVLIIVAVIDVGLVLPTLLYMMKKKKGLESL